MFYYSVNILKRLKRVKPLYPKAKAVGFYGLEMSNLSREFMNANFNLCTVFPVSICDSL